MQRYGHRFQRYEVFQTVPRAIIMANFLIHAQRAKALTRNRVCANVAFSVLVDAGLWQRT